MKRPAPCILKFARPDPPATSGRLVIGGREYIVRSELRDRDGEPIPFLPGTLVHIEVWAAGTEPPE